MMTTVLFFIGMSFCVGLLWAMSMVNVAARADSIAENHYLYPSEEDDYLFGYDEDLESDSDWHVVLISRFDSHDSEIKEYFFDTLKEAALEVDEIISSDSFNPEKDSVSIYYSRQV
jgi:hypothetical protein